eukprot:TRINITY_DN104095_c0_g1_i1.p1 TRINITY_DN104095_c0_g1~~TRINITY_DN104095_c0_g1_i1.p1  ORF type:complete len:224 (-),score=37.37 TRINITY_DN104095_c0_g1_i1:210-881(-)
MSAADPLNEGSSGNVNLGGPSQASQSQSAAQSQSAFSGSRPAMTPLEEAQQRAAGEMARAAANRAGQAVRAGAQEINMYIQGNPASITVLSFIGGLCLLVVSLFGCFNVLSIIADPLAYVFNLYQVLFAGIICIIDGPERFPSLRETVLVHASFLHNNKSRTLFYLFVAALLNTEDVWYEKIIGWFFVFIAVAHVILICANMRKSSQAPDQPLHPTAPPPGSV